MNSRRSFLRGMAVVPTAALAMPRVTWGAEQVPTAAFRSDRDRWLDATQRIAEPVLVNMAARRLKTVMPVEAQPASVKDRARFTHLEAIGRLLAGLAPWLESAAADGPEGALQARFADLARQAIDAATDPASPDFANFTEGAQPLVDAAFLAHAILRAPTQLWSRLPPGVQRHLVAALVSTRRIRPGFNNWLLFSAMVEAALYRVGETWDAMRVDYALRQHEQWYRGDGVYGDGPAFHWDYYNSFVIQPMLLDVLGVVSSTNPAWEALREPVLTRARRFAAIQERLISPEGTFPPLGRSLAYRFGAFQLLGQIALMHELPDGIFPAQVRCALTAVIRRTLDAPGTFDPRGWLTIGFAGHQPSIGETYISTGSTYLCATGLLPLGLPPSDEFWSGPPRDWTAKRAWSGENLPPDQAI